MARYAYDGFLPRKGDRWLSGSAATAGACSPRGSRRRSPQAPAFSRDGTAVRDRTPGTDRYNTIAARRHDSENVRVEIAGSPA
jgi:hypothetical protein